MGKKGILESHPKWTPIFIKPKVIIDQKRPEEPDDPPEPPEEEEQEKKSEKDPSAPTDGEAEVDVFMPFLWALGAILFLFLVIRPLCRFYPFLPHKNQRAVAMLIALRWLDLYGQRREYGETFIDFSKRLRKRLKLKGFEEMAWEHRREFTDPKKNRKNPVHWAGRLKELRKSLRINENLKPPKMLQAEVLWKVFGFPHYPKKVQKKDNERN